MSVKFKIPAAEINEVIEEIEEAINEACEDGDYEMFSTDTRTDLARAAAAIVLRKYRPELVQELAMNYAAKIIADSLSPAGHRISTLECTFPRFILAEYNTHRVLSRNSASSRAIPVDKNIERIEANPFVPLAFTKNQKGMQASDVIDEKLQKKAVKWWLRALNACTGAAEVLLGIDVHKQHANRLLEPWGWQTVVTTATEWDNFWALRTDAGAQPEMQVVAGLMKTAYDASRPVQLDHGEWHLPYVNKGEELTGMWRWNDWVKISAARCARVSSLAQDGVRDIGKDLELYERLVKPGHMSPLEHPCRPMTERELGLFTQTRWVWNETDQDWYAEAPDYYTHFLGNVQGWVQHRKMIKNEHNFALIRGS